MSLVVADGACVSVCVCAFSWDQDVPALSPVLQKGAYWRWTCFVLFDDSTDEDSGIWILSCARLPRNCVCVCVCVCVRVCVCV